MDMISKESAYKAIKNVCDKFNMAFGVSKWSKGSFSVEIATCLDELPVYDLDEIGGVIKAAKEEFSKQEESEDGE